MNHDSLTTTFVNITESNYIANKEIIKKYTEDYTQILSQAENHFLDFHNVKAHIKNFKELGCTKLFSQFIIHPYTNSVCDLSQDFTDAILSNYVGLDKHIKLLFSEKGMRAKTLYQIVDENNDLLTQTIYSKAHVFSNDTHMLDEIAKALDNNISKSFKRNRFKKYFYLMWLPLLVFLIFLGGISFFLYNILNNITSNLSLENTLGAVPKILNVTGTVLDFVTKYKINFSSFFLNMLWYSLPLTVILFTIYAFIVTKLINKSLYSSLLKQIKLSFAIFQSTQSQMKEDYLDSLNNQLRQIDEIYLAKYKKLFESLTTNILLNEKENA